MRWVILQTKLQITAKKKCEIELSDTNDFRSYFASFKKIQNTLEFSAKYSIKDGVEEMYESLAKGILTDSIKTRTVDWYKELLSNPDLKKQYSMNDTIL